MMSQNAILDSSFSPSSLSFPPLGVRLLLASAVLTAVTTVVGGGIPASAQASAPVLAFANAASGGESDLLLRFDLADGSGLLIDRLGRSPLAPRARRLNGNLFEALGRPTEQAAAVGEILLGPLHAGDGSVTGALFVETPIGYVASFDQLGKGGKLGEIHTAVGRPFEGLASTDGNFALLMQRERSGRTRGAFLYHATAGRALYLDNPEKLGADTEVSTVTDLPQLTGPVSAVALHGGSEATASFLVIDSATGAIHFLVPGERPGTLSARASELDAWTVFPRESERRSGRRFLALPIFVSQRRTPHALLVDAATGQVALIENVLEPAARLLASSVDLDQAFGEAEERTLSVVPHVDGSGATIGAWLIDQAGKMIYLERPTAPEEMLASPVRLQ